jgi:hypothetical protein
VNNDPSGGLSNVTLLFTRVLPAQSNMPNSRRTYNCLPDKLPLSSLHAAIHLPQFLSYGALIKVAAS